MANDAVVTVVESSPTQVLSKLTPAEHKTWRATGNLPEPEVKPAKTESTSTEVAASSSAAKEVTEAPAKVTEMPAESVPAKSDSEPKPKQNAETRIKELLAEVKVLQSRIDARERAASAAPAKSEEPRKPQRSDWDEKAGRLKHAGDDGAFSEDRFQDALIDYGIERGSYKTRQGLAKQAQEQLQAELNQLVTTELQSELEAVEQRHTDFREVLMAKTDDKGRAQFEHPEIRKIVSNGNLDVRIAESPVGWEMLYWLCQHPGIVDRIQSQRTAKTFGREFRALERAVEQAMGEPKVVAPKEGPVVAASTSPAPKISGAPAPAASVSGKATAPVNEEQAALEAEDFKRYQRTANENEWRAKKGK